MLIGGGTLYSHHQKMTIVDTGPYERRTVTSFIGGLDLTGGRWDTPSHSLFSSLQREHKHDFRNKSWSVRSLNLFPLFFYWFRHCCYKYLSFKHLKITWTSEQLHVWFMSIAEIITHRLLVNVAPRESNHNT